MRAGEGDVGTSFYRIARGDLPEVSSLLPRALALVLHDGRLQSCPVLTQHTGQSLGEGMLGVPAGLQWCISLFANQGLVSGAARVALQDRRGLCRAGGLMLEPRRAPHSEHNRIPCKCQAPACLVSQHEPRCAPKWPGTVTVGSEQHVCQTSYPTSIV